ncbi:MULTISPECIES: hypothetical protein [Bacteria]|uniref:hypothetical protein n=1 Tax=Bacteria TaxID=2 RepID=UPI00026D7704|nr:MULTISPECIES: hypothetical protein [Bacteria]ETC92893.1 hypothetical protein T481_04125 [Enterococcus faecalis PF3]DAI07601.1 MAG TPA: hypothetical protein [Caudoviricetes sp.]AFO45172.1 hypothetical protein EFD32_2290 [Enterococcus faecalis D32]AQL54550.1 hypothetical protein BZG32_12930 [Enterococcus faecalis]EGO2668714.1 hypothetical protein [Enterococcus faecalis]
MDYSKIVFTLELYDDNANSSANALLEDGWLLISVGPKLIDIVNGQAYYNTSYVVGATKEQYESYLQEESSSLI